MANPNSLFRWEDSAGLEHACWACPTKANSPRALHSCYGIHSMPCASYHPTMHAIGGAHRCSACAMERKMHDNRHREIAELVAEYKVVDTESMQTPTRSIPLLERPVNLAHRRGHQSLTPILNRIDQINNGEKGPDSDNEENSADDDDTISLVSNDLSTSTTTTDTSTTRKLTKAQQRAQKKAKKSQRAQDKAMKNQGRQLATVTAADINLVAQIMHGVPEDDIQNTAHPLATDRTIEDVIARNLGFVRHIQTHKQFLYKSIAAGRKETKERKRLKRKEQKGDYEDIETEEVVNAILIKLGINFSCSASSSSGQSTEGITTTNEPRNRRKRASSASVTLGGGIGNTPGGSKTKAQILQKLRDAIKHDLEKHENDVRGTYVRAGGFWRYVGKAVFDRMTEIARDMDVSTGENWEKKMKREANSREKAKDQNHEDE